MEFTYETYSLFLSKLKINDNKFDEKIKLYLQGQNIYLFNPEIFNDIRNFDIDMMRKEDLIEIEMFDKELQHELTMQGIDKMSIYCFEMFEKINAHIEHSPNKNTLQTEYLTFKNLFESIYNQMFNEIQLKKYVLNIYNELITTTFDWILVYISVQFSSEIFKIVLKSSNLLNSKNLDKLLTWKQSKNQSLLKRIIASNNLMTFIEEIGKINAVKLFFVDHTLLTKSIYLLINTIVSENQKEQEIITNMLLNKRNQNGDNFMHIVLSSVDIINNLNIFLPYKSLLNEKNNAGFLCKFLLTTMPQDSVKKFLDFGMITPMDLLTKNDDNIALSDIFFICFVFFDDMLENKKIKYTEEMLKNLIPTLVYYIHNTINESYNEPEESDAYMFQIDDSYVIEVLFKEINNLIANVENKDKFLLEEVLYYDGKKYPLFYYLFSMGLHEQIFRETCFTTDLLYVTYENFLKKYPFLFPSKYTILYDNDNSLCKETIKKLINYDKTEYIDNFYEYIFNNNYELVSHLTQKNKITFLQDSFSFLDTTKSPYNMLKIFSDFLSDKTTPETVINSLNDDLYCKILNRAIEMYVFHTYKYVNHMIFVKLYELNKELFLKTFEKSEEWPTCFLNDDEGEIKLIFDFLTDKIVKKTKMSHKTIFGSNTDDLPCVFTIYSKNAFEMYKKLIEFGQLDSYYYQNFNNIYKLLSTRDITITSAIKILPFFSSNVFFEKYEEDEDLFKQSCEYGDVEYCDYILKNFCPSLEYKQNFILTYDFKNNSKLTHLLLKHCFLTCEVFKSPQDYMHLITFLANNIDNEDFLKMLNNLTENEFLMIFSNEILPNMIELFINFGEKFVEVIVKNLKYKSFKDKLSYYEDVLLNIVQKPVKTKLLIELIENDIFTLNNIVALIDVIIETPQIFKYIIFKYDIIEIIQEESKKFNKSIKESILAKIFQNEVCFEIFFQFVLNSSNTEKFHKLIKYSEENSFDILNIFLQKYTFEKTEEFVTLFLETNHKLISNIMITQLLSLNKKYLITKCIELQININEINLNEIIAKYPDCVLLLTNVNDLILKFTDANIVELFNSENMTLETQDFVLEYLLKNEKYDTLGQCIYNIKKKSSFFEKHHKAILKLIENDNEIFYSLMKNNVCVEQYLLTTDSNYNYMLPFIPCGYIDDSLVEIFCSKLTIEDLNKTDKFGRSIFNNICNKTVLKFVLAKPDINKFYENNLDTLKTAINHIAINHYELIKQLPKNIINTITNQNNQNILMILIESGNCENALDFINNECSDVSFEHIDNNGCNILFYAIIEPNVFEIVLKIYIKKYGIDCVKIHNKQNETLLMYAIKYGSHNSSFELLLENDFFRTEQNYIYKNTGSILTYGALYLNFMQFETLMCWKYIQKTNINVTQNFMIYDWFSGDNPLTKKYKATGSLLAIASYKNATIFKNLLKYYESQLRELVVTLKKEQIVIGKHSYSHIEFAYLYNPESFQHIIGLPFVNDIIIDHLFFSKNLHIQPASWFYYTQSKIYKNTISDIYKVSYYLRPGSQIQSISHIVQSKQECAESQTDICNICSVGKKKIMFGCNLHLACVSCGCLIEKCPECNNDNHSKKIKIFD